MLPKPRLLLTFPKTAHHHLNFGFVMDLHWTVLQQSTAPGDQLHDLHYNLRLSWPPNPVPASS